MLRHLELDVIVAATALLQLLLLLEVGLLKELELFLFLLWEDLVEAQEEERGDIVLEELACEGEIVEAVDSAGEEEVELM